MTNDVKILAYFSPQLDAVMERHFWGDALATLAYFSLHPEGMPDRTGLQLSKELVALGIPVKLVIDSAVAYTMDEVDMVFVGADGVVESGGIINMIGTYQISLVAHSMNKPVYVAAESYKFARLYPLDPKDPAPAVPPIDFGAPIPAGVEVEKSARDYTPLQYLMLLFGVRY
ncbi:hypothetical protein ACLOJK_009022 [Asimina triloba]